MELRSLQKKHVRSYAKNGWCRADFCEKYRCTEEEFESRVHQVFKDEKSAKECLEKISSNTGKRKPKRNTTDVDHSYDELNELQKEEVDLSKEVRKLEVDFQSLKKRHKEKLQNLRDKKSELEAFRDEILKERKKTERLIRQSNVVVEKMNETSKKWSEKTSALDEMRKRIEKLKKLTLCIFDDGTITNYEDGAEVKLDDAGHEGVYAELVKSEDLDNLRQREVKLLARLLTMRRNSSLEVEIICDSKELEEAFESLKKEE